MQLTYITLNGDYQNKTESTDFKIIVISKKPASLNLHLPFYRSFLTLNNATEHSSRLLTQDD